MNDYNLKEEIKKLGFTQKGFAENIGVGEQTVGQWVRGVIPAPKWVKLLINLLHKEKKLKEIRELLKDIL